MGTAQKQANIPLAGSIPERGGMVYVNTTRTQEISEKEPNKWGLSDMCNVSEWVWDTSMRKYIDETITDPVFSVPGMGTES